MVPEALPDRIWQLWPVGCVVMVAENVAATARAVGNVNELALGPTSKRFVVLPFSVSTIPGLVSPLMDPPTEYSVVPTAGAFVRWWQALSRPMPAATSPQRIQVGTTDRGWRRTAVFNGSSSSWQSCNVGRGATGRRDPLGPKPANLPSLL